LGKSLISIPIPSIKFFDFWAYNNFVLLIEIVTLFVLIDMFANVAALVLAVKKFDVFENIFLLQWKQSTVIQLFTLLGFLVWFFFKAVGCILPAFEEKFELSFLLVVVFFFFIGHILLASILLRGVSKVES